MVPAGSPNRQKASVSTSRLERRLHVRDAREPDREAERVEREDHLQGEEAGALGGHG